MIRIHNTETNEVIDREMTTAEFTLYEYQQVKAQTEANEKAAIEAARISALAKLAALGLTTEEISAIS